MNFKLSDVCQIYVNRKMTQKLLHLKADEVFINPDVERKLLEKCKNIEVHSVLLSCESIRKQHFRVPKSENPFIIMLVNKNLF